MTGKEVEKADDVLQAIHDTVCELGGGEEDMLRVAQDKALARQVAFVVVGLAGINLHPASQAVNHAKSEGVRRKVLEGTTAEIDLRYFAIYDPSAALRSLAVDKIESQQTLYSVAVNCAKNTARLGTALEALDKLDSNGLKPVLEDTTLLLQVRLSAIRRLAELGRNATLIEFCKHFIVDAGRSEADLRVFRQVYSVANAKDADLARELQAKNLRARELISAKTHTRKSAELAAEQDV